MRRSLYISADQAASAPSEPLWWILLCYVSTGTGVSRILKREDDGILVTMCVRPVDVCKDFPIRHCRLSEMGGVK